MTHHAALARSISAAQTAAAAATVRFECPPECECSIHWQLTKALRALNTAAREFERWS